MCEGVFCLLPVSFGRAFLITVLAIILRIVIINIIIASALSSSSSVSSENSVFLKDVWP